MRRLMVYASVMMSIVLSATGVLDAQPMAAWQGTDVAVDEGTAARAIGRHAGGLVFIDCTTGTISHFNPTLCAEPLAPCSTFKIWNTLIGLESGEIVSADEPFYTWDGEIRSMSAWNRDLNLREAFRVSCVPAFQTLALKIGEHRMRYWLERIGYGDCDMSSGLDVFWLPRAGHKPILISADLQATLLRQLLQGELPFSAASCAVLKDLMTVKTTARGTLYGKTGSSGPLKDADSIGWFVGYVESAGRTVVFACVMKGDNLAGKDARAAVEEVLTKQGLL